MIHEFDPIIYPRKIWITYDASIEELKEQFGSKFDFDEDDSYNALTYRVNNIQTDKGGVLIRFMSKDKMTSPNMAHEAVHAANRICDYVGINADWENDEAVAYLVSFIVKCCEEVKKG